MLSSLKSEIPVAGPYRSGTGDDPTKLAANVRAMNETALELFRAGHLGVTGEALALPLLEVSGPAAFDEIFHPVAELLLSRCDAEPCSSPGSSGSPPLPEDITVIELDFDEALAMIRTGEITDAKTIMLLQWAALDDPFRARNQITDSLIHHSGVVGCPRMI